MIDGKGLLLAIGVASSTMAIAVTAAADTVRTVRSPQDAFDEVATIIEGHVESISFSYNPQQGPRIIAHFVDVVSHAGTPVGRSLKLATLGGPLPDGRGLQVSGLAEFDPGKTYVVFLTATDWFDSPVVEEYAFRVESANGAERIVSQTGNPVIGFSLNGIHLGFRSVDSPVRDLMQGRPQVAEAPQILASAALKATFIADLVRLHAERKLSLSLNDPTVAAIPKTFKTTPRTDRIWNVITPSGPSGGPPADVPMCIEVDEPPVCE